MLGGRLKFCCLFLSLLQTKTEGKLKEDQDAKRKTLVDRMNESDAKNLLAITLSVLDVLDVSITFRYCLCKLIVEPS